MPRSTAKEVRKLLCDVVRRLFALVVQNPNVLRIRIIVVLVPLIFCIVIGRVAPTGLVMRRNIWLAPVGARVEQQAHRRIQPSDDMLNAVIASCAELDAAITVIVIRLHIRIGWQREAGRLVANRIAIGRGCRIGRVEGRVVQIGLHNVPAGLLILTIVGSNRLFSVKLNG